jgi:DUF1365 family protein
VLTPAIYRTTITHRRRAPVRHEFDYRSYSWYVDVDALPRLSWWLRPFARFDPRDHLDGLPGDTLRHRVEAFLAGHDAARPGGRITALLQPRVLGYVFNPLTVFWCHDRDDTVCAVIAEVHNTYGQRHAYLLPPADTPVRVAKSFYVSPFNPVDGHYLVRAPRPDRRVNVSVSLHRDNEPTFVAALHGSRRPATVARLAWLQLAAPLAPLVVAVRIRVQGIRLWLRRVPVVPQ